jgi:hypothetical protein
VTKSTTQEPGKSRNKFRAPPSYRQNIAPHAIENRLPVAFMKKLSKLQLESPAVQASDTQPQLKKVGAKCETPKQTQLARS